MIYDHLFFSKSYVRMQQIVFSRQLSTHAILGYVADIVLLEAIHKYVFSRFLANEIFRVSYSVIWFVSLITLN